jgi:hypothetical protein
MKKLVLSAALLIGASMMILSCNNGAYDANPNTNNGGIGVPNTGGGSGGGGSFDWSGTDPISAKIDGQAWQGTTGTYVAGSGIASIMGGNSMENISLAFPENATAGTTINLGGTTSISYVKGTTMFNSTIGGNGTIKITENDATHIKGLFYGTVKELTGSGSHTITEGYFNIKK